MSYELLEHNSFSTIINGKKDRLIAYVTSVLCVIFLFVIIILASTRITHVTQNECNTEENSIEKTSPYSSIEFTSIPITESSRISKNTSSECITPVINNTSIISTKNVCMSEECIQSAADILLSMNTSVNPCDDFYRFSCGRWSSQHPNHAWFSENSDFAIIETKVTTKTLKLLKEDASKSEPVPVHQSRDLFRSCVDQDTRDEYGYKPVLKYLSKLGLPAVPRYFNMTGKNQDINLYKFDWIKTDVAMNKLLDVQLFVDCDVETNMYDTSKNTIIFRVPQNKLLGYESLALSAHQHNKLMAIKNLMDSEKVTTYDKKIINAHVSFMKFAIKAIVSENSNLPVDFENRLSNAINAINEFENYLEQIKEKVNSYVGQDYYNITSVEELQSYSDIRIWTVTQEIPSEKLWEPYLNQLFNGTKVSLNSNNKNEIHILPAHENYYGAIAALLSVELDATIELWAWWQAVKNLIIHTTSDVKVTMDKFLNSVDDNRPSRDISCATLTKNYMDYAVSYALADVSFFKTVKPKVENMLRHIKNAFKNSVNAIAWMDEPTKKLTIEKSSAMKDLIGFPEWLLNKKLLEKYYSSLVINAETYLDNLVKVTTFKRTLTLERLHMANDNNWHDSPLKVNAYNNLLLNTIIIPMAIIDFPFYKRGLDALNFGTLGAILGHELTHGFDNNGRKYNKHGNYDHWWSSLTILNFLYRAECFIDQYNAFYVSDVGAYINGTITLAENIADNGGLHHAFVAYQNHKKLIGEEFKLPGLEEYTNDQLFFMAFAGIWCDDEDKGSLELRLQNSHCPNKYRVLGTLTNSNEFATAFNCPVGSKMNPNTQKCKLW